MAIEPTTEAVVLARRSALLTDIANAAQATEQAGQAKAVGRVTEDAQNLRALNTSPLPLDPNRGRNLDVSV